MKRTITYSTTLNQTKLNPAFIKWILFFILFIGGSSLRAATITITSDTNWGSITTGTGVSGKPSAADDIIVRSQATLTVNVSDGVCKSITLGGGSTNNSGILVFSTSTSQVTISGTLTMAAITNRTNRLTMTAGGKLICQGIIVNTSNAAFTEGTGTVQLTANNTLPTTVFTPFNNLIISGGTTTNTSALAVAGDLTINSGATWNTTGSPTLSVAGSISNSGTFTAGTGVHTLSGTGETLSGTVSIPSLAVTGTYTNNGTLTVSTALSGTGTLANASTLNIPGTSSVTNLSNSGTLAISGTGAITTTLANFTNTGTINLSGSGTITGITNNTTGTLNISTTPTITGLTVSAVGNTVNYNGAGAQTVKAVSYSNLILSGSGAKTLLVGMTTINNDLTLSGTATTTGVVGLTINGDVTIGSGTTFTAGSFTHAVKGDWTNNGTFTTTGSTISLNGTTQTIGGSSATTFNNLSLSGGTKTFNNATVVSGNLSVASGAIANLGSIATHTAGTLTLGGLGTAAANFGSTSTLAPLPAYKTNTYFTAGTTGYITVATGTCNATVTVATIVSNNSFNTSYAKNGDVITVSFTTSEVADTTPTVTINGVSATVSGSGTSWSATKTVSSDSNGLVTFSISYQTAFGCSGTRSTVTNGSSVTVDTVSPTIPTTTIASNNANTSLARATNVITLSFTTSETPAATPTAIINGASATVSGSGTSYTATRTVAGGDTNGVVPFSISIRDIAGNTASQTATTNGSSVIVDTTAPIIQTATIESDNATTTLAKAGDIITVDFTTSETPNTTPTVTISLGAASVTGSGTSWSATRTVLSNDANGIAPFSITIADAAGNTATRSTISTGSSVTVDTIAPTIPTGTIISNNATTTLAKAGDTITLTFTTNQNPAVTPIVTISGGSASVSGSGTSYTATRTVLALDTNGVAPFSISVSDAAGNTTLRTSTSNLSSVTIDTAAPTVATTSIASNNATNSLARAGNVITLTFTTSQTPSATPVVTISGGAASVSGSGASYTATRTVLGVDTNGIAPFSITIRDAAGNTSVQTTTTNGSSVTVDTLTPSIPSASIVSNNAITTLAKAGDTITLSFTTSETPNATPIVAGANSVTGSGTSWTATRIVLANDTNGVAAISITISDAAGNSTTRNSTIDGSSVTIDTQAPTIPTGTIASNNTTTTLAKAGDTITLTFTTSQTPAATPVVTINSLSATVSGSGSSYTATRIVAGGDTNGIAPFSISISDAAGNTASRTTLSGGSSVTVDTVAPTIATASIASNNATTTLAKAGDIITVSFTTSETPSATPVVTISGGTATVSGSGTSYTATRIVAGGDANGIAPFSISIRDAVGNTTSQTTTTNSSSVTIDTLAPTIPSASIASNNAIPTLAKAGDIITLSFTTSETPNAVPTVTISGGSATVSGSGTSYTATRTVLGADTNGIAPFSISITDITGNGTSRSTTTDGSSVTIDTVAPTIPTATIASNNTTPSLAKAGDTITLTFTTNQTPAATPVVTINGASATVIGSGTSYTATITVSGGDTNGIVPFSISISDAAGNSTSQTATTNGSSVTIDTESPTFLSVSIASSNASSTIAGTGDVITLNFTTSESIATTPVVSIEGSAASVSGSGTSWTATKTIINCSDNVVTFSINLSDPSGNSASRTTTTDGSQVTVNPTPTATIVNNGGAICSGFNAAFTVNGSNGATLDYTITGQLGTQQLVLNGTNQTITALNATSNVTLTLTNVANANCSSTTFATGTSTVTVNALPIVTAANVTGCSGVNITLSGSPLGGTFSVANPYNGTSNTTYTYSYTDGNNCSATSSTANITIVANQTWYLDADNDGYSSDIAPSVIDCTRPVGGYKLSSELTGVGTDCNDSIAGIHPGALEIDFNNIDENCNNNLFDGHPPVIVNITATPSLLPSMTTTISASTATSTSPYSGAAVTYIFKVTKTSGVTSVAYVNSNTPSFAISSASNAAHSSTYNVTATAVVNGEEQPYNGNTRAFTTPAAPTIPLTTQTGAPNAPCAYTLAKIDSYIYANNSTTYGANRFEFTVERVGASPAEIVIVPTTGPYFRLTAISGIPASIQVLYGATYKVKVRYGYDSYGSAVWSNYGSDCLVTTPALAVPAVTCGPLASINAYLYASGATPGANLYEFKVTRVSAPAQGELAISPPGNTEEVVPRTVNNFKLSMLTTLFLGLQKEYNVSVRYRINSYGTQQFSGWSAVNCPVYTPDFPATMLIDEQCDQPGVPSTLTQYIYSYNAPGATSYRFRLTKVGTTLSPQTYDYTVESPDRYVKLIEFPGLTAGFRYSISVVAVLYGETASWISVKECSLVAPASTPVGPTKDVVLTKFKATAYPNPFATNFLIDVKTSSQSIVNLKVYDMIGRLIEQRDVQASEISSTTIGDRYPSGVYNVVVSQQDNVETVRVVKR